jgi:hypothetical protein
VLQARASGGDVTVQRANGVALMLPGAGGTGEGERSKRRQRHGHQDASEHVSSSAGIDEHLAPPCRLPSASAWAA